MSTQYPVDHQIMTVSAVEAFRGGGIEGFASVSALLPDGSQLRNPSSSRKPSRLYRLGVVERERERASLSLQVETSRAINTNREPQHLPPKHVCQLQRFSARRTCDSISC